MAVKNNKATAGLEFLERTNRYSARRNNIPLVKNTGDRHWWGVARLAKELFDQGCEVVCEARFLAGPRADIYLPELLLVIEVLDSEQATNINHKRAEYHKTPVRVGWVTVDEAEELGSVRAVELAITRAGQQKVGS